MARLDCTKAEEFNGANRGFIAPLVDRRVRNETGNSSLHDAINLQFPAVAP